MRTTITMTVDTADGEGEVEVTGTVEPLVRGRTHGLPENCYPDEGGEVEVETATLDGKPYELTPAQEERAKELLAEAVEDEGSDPPDYDDPADDYDREEHGR